MSPTPSSSATSSSASSPASPSLLPLPRRDFILLPLISLLTALLMGALAEFGSRQIWVEKANDDCAVGGRHKANCTMLMKNIEGPWVRYETNDCGYRGTASCGPKPAGNLRAVVMGTSVAFGLHIPYDQFFAARAAPELSKIWHHPVEVQNLGDIMPLWLNNDATLKEMAALKPDAVFLIVAPFDLSRAGGQGEEEGAVPKKANEVKTGWTWTDARLALRESRVLYMAQHFLLNDEKFFLHAFEEYADPNDASRTPTPPLVEQRFGLMEERVAKAVEYARPAGAEVFMVALPNRVQCALISKRIRLPHMDPYIFNSRMKEIALRHEVNYIDLIPDLERTPNAERLFYSVDGHPAAGAHSLMASAIVHYFRKRGGLCSTNKNGTAR